MIPSTIRNITVIPWEEFEKGIDTAPIYKGDAWILKGAFSPEFIEGMKSRCIEWCRQRPSEFHKIHDFCPDYHRVIDEKVSGLYSIKAIKHSAYFFRWNDDPLDIWPTITERWRVIKKAMGLESREYERNNPSDGPTDRIQIVRYPPRIGYLESHRDAYQHQPFFISGYMSKRGVDYQGGGFYFLKDGEPVYLEDQIDVGDICIGHANLLHGVAACDGEPDWNKTDGRWFLGLYSNPSDYEKNRATSRPE